MTHNLNTTIDKIALSEFNTHYDQLGNNEKQWCHDEMINNDKWLKSYTTALIKQQWGQNLSKFEGMQLPGGVTMNGMQILNDATEEIRRLEEEIRLTHELPADFFIG